MQICSKSHVQNLVNTPSSSSMSNLILSSISTSISSGGNYHNNNNQIQQHQQQQSQSLLGTNQKPKRPTSLPVIKQEPNSSPSPSGSTNVPITSHGISITTPSNGLAFDTLVDWLPSTGLTPTATSAAIPLMTPNTCNAVLSSLQTPTTSNNKFTSL